MPKWTEEAPNKPVPMHCEVCGHDLVKAHERQTLVCDWCAPAPDAGDIYRTDICLEIRSMDLARGAFHFYGKLHPSDGDPVILTRELSKKDAGVLNKRHGCKSGEAGAYKSGQTYEGFDSVKEAVDKALEQWQHLFPGAERLVWARPYWAKHEGVLAVRKPHRN